jgi:23S rRNA pseudouridine1911/1915/1917 synthase
MGCCPPQNAPYIVDETETYVVVYKPPLMFSAPLDGGMANETLLGWCAERCPAVLEPRGAKALEGGLLHRLDFETQGLVLFAKTQGALESLRRQQGAGDFVKEYDALTGPGGASLSGFTGPPGIPPLPGFPPPPAWSAGGREPGPYPGACIESFFRPWGPGRKAVRPVAGPLGPGKKGREIACDRGGYYRTEIIAVKTLPRPGLPEQAPGPRLFRLRIYRGFRHQIRCHLAWIGAPILHDALYGGENTGGGERRPIALRAALVCFSDPPTGERKTYSLPLTGFPEGLFQNQPVLEQAR